MVIIIILFNIGIAQCTFYLNQFQLLKVVKLKWMKNFINILQLSSLHIFTMWYKYSGLLNWKWQIACVRSLRFYEFSSIIRSFYWIIYIDVSFSLCNLFVRQTLSRGKYVIEVLQIRWYMFEKLAERIRSKTGRSSFWHLRCRLIRPWVYCAHVNCWERPIHVQISPWLYFSTYTLMSSLPTQELINCVF